MDPISTEDLLALDNALFQQHSQRFASDDRAFTRYSLFPKEQLLARLRLPLDPEAGPQSKQLVNHGVTTVWRLITLTGTEFEAAVPSRDDRRVVRDFLAELGFRVDTDLPEELLRVIMERPKDIFQAKPELREVVAMDICDFMPKYGFPLNEIEGWAILCHSNILLVEQLMAYNRHDLLERLARGRHGYQLAEQLICKFDKALTAAGLWFDFKQTESERAAWPHR